MVEFHSIHWELEHTIVADYYGGDWISTVSRSTSRSYVKKEMGEETRGLLE